jgi:hypothetical protein
MRVVVTLTTIPSREQSVLKTIESIKKNTYQPDDIYVNVPEWYPKFKQSPTEKLLNSLELLGVKVNMCKDYGTLTKLYPILNIENDIAIMVDDDAYYSENFIKGLVDGYKEFNCAVGYSGIAYPETVLKHLGKIGYAVYWGHGVQTEILECAFGFLVPINQLKLIPNFEPMSDTLNCMYFSDDYIWSRLLDNKKVIRYDHIGRVGDDWSSIRRDNEDLQTHSLSRDGNNLLNFYNCRNLPFLQPGYVRTD